MSKKTSTGPIYEFNHLMQLQLKRVKLLERFLVSPKLQHLDQPSAERLLMVLLEMRQYKNWRERIGKFINWFGENFPQSSMVRRRQEDGKQNGSNPGSAVQFILGDPPAPEAFGNVEAGSD